VSGPLKRSTSMNNGKLIKQLQKQNANPIQNRNSKYTFCCTIFIGVYKISKQGNIGNKAPNSKKSNEPVLSEECSEKLIKVVGRKPNEVNKDKYQ